MSYLIITQWSSWCTSVQNIHWEGISSVPLHFIWSVNYYQQWQWIIVKMAAISSGNTGSVFLQTAAVVIRVLVGITLVWPTEQSVVMSANDGTANHLMDMLRRTHPYCRMTRWVRSAIIVVIIATTLISRLFGATLLTPASVGNIVLGMIPVVVSINFHCTFWISKVISYYTDFRHAFT